VRRGRTRGGAALGGRLFCRLPQSIPELRCGGDRPMGSGASCSRMAGPQKNLPSLCAGPKGIGRTPRRLGRGAERARPRTFPWFWGGGFGPDLGPYNKDHAQSYAGARFGLRGRNGPRAGRNLHSAFPRGNGHGRRSFKRMTCPISPKQKRWRAFGATFFILSDYAGGHSAFSRSDGELPTLLVCTP